MCVMRLQTSASKATLTIAFAFIVASVAFAQTQPPTAPTLPNKTSANQVTQMWPDAPSSDNVFDILISASTSKAPPSDPVQQIASDGRFRGTLAYAPRVKVPNEPIAQRFLVLRAIGGSGQNSPAKITSIASYPLLEGDRDFFDPQFSPDGKQLLFKAGNPNGSYYLQLWNFSAKTLRRVFKFQLTYPIVLWSPNSNYLAFVRSGSEDGKTLNSYDRSYAPTLCIYNIKIEQYRSIQELSQVVDFTWTQQNTLLYTVKSIPKSTAGTAFSVTRQMSGYDIYEVSAVNINAPKRLIRNARNPAPSPDGKSIVFFGWNSPPPSSASKATSAPSSSTQPSLLLLNRSHNKTVLVRPQASGTVRWTPDSRRFLLIDSTYKMTPSGQGLSEARIATIDSATLAATELTTISAQDYQYLPRSKLNSQIQPLDVSKDGKYLFVQISESVGKQLRAVDLKSGKVFTVVSLLNSGGRVIGWSWHDESTPLPTQTK